MRLDRSFQMLLQHQPCLWGAGVVACSLVMQSPPPYRPSSPLGSGLSALAPPPPGSALVLGRPLFTLMWSPAFFLPALSLQGFSTMSSL